MGSFTTNNTVSFFIMSLRGFSKRFFPLHQLETQNIQKFDLSIQIRSLVSRYLLLFSHESFATVWKNTFWVEDQNSILAPKFFSNIKSVLPKNFWIIFKFNNVRQPGRNLVRGNWPHSFSHLGTYKGQRKVITAILFTLVPSYSKIR